MATPGFLRIVLAQINTTVGDLAGNRRRMRAAYRAARDAGAQLIVFPELALTGYPPEDLLLRPSFVEDTRAALEALAPEFDAGAALVGTIERGPDGLQNAAALIAAGEVRDVYAKCTLPNYGVFDEKRYFVPGRRCPVYQLGPWRIAVTICEDIWVTGGVARVQAAHGGANLLCNLSASPYHARKGQVREELIRFRARELRLPIVQTNLVGGQDELVFDGQSLAVTAEGALVARGAQFREQLLMLELPAPGTTPPAVPPHKPPAESALLELGQREAAPPEASLELAVIAGDRAWLSATRRSRAPRPTPGVAPAPPGWPISPPAAAVAAEIASEAEEIYRALTLGLHDYVRKNGAGGAVIGLSGGIDSALTAAIAVDALGADRVVGISMPSVYSSPETRGDARQTADNLGIAFHELAIQSLFEHLLEELRPLLADRPPDVTEENLQARIRGMILMAFSNKFGHLVLATGNKSEVAVGYCTLYGDMVGGFSVLKDVLKTQVYRLAAWRNAQAPDRPPIPPTTLTRPPSAELRAGQRDTDALPPYETLDPLVRAFVERDAAPRDLRAQGLPAGAVAEVFALIQGNEYKRRQAAPGIKITPRAFGRDRRYPLTNRYRPGEIGDEGPLPSGSQ